jgi:uncharacterized protein
MERPTSPWWRHGMVWLVFGGPAAVIAASIATLVIAIANPDPVLPTLAAPTAAAAPAVQGRNHAATR